ncbi:cardiolipin synthase [Pseudooceanicola sediminis]|uniref:Cardiolipin synthase n=1 Tax=Pseudooceanicola sediminis TaxID=2211117 RepID=A0A399J3F2_9RHOB|nr:cardiolipin synthase [Pseudooceanicola sediminis]KAA2314198.1 cardiolipin synthase [Puniceibacterium sp. HSS470]RII39943.1 cardiolipin synthase [Pseudooceanicola sediminis]|tara:strand:- start:108604 stop:110217 length:1614 start_codon:yes stop_codon:yes gene_type:complete
MTDLTLWPATLLVAHVILQAIFIVRALLRPHREPSARMAWVLVIMGVPALGMLGYFLFGETNIGRRRAALYRETAQMLEGVQRHDPDRDVAAEAGPGAAGGGMVSDADAGGKSGGGAERGGAEGDPHAHLFHVGTSISGLHPVDGNTAHLMESSDAAIDAIVADMDAARAHVHLLFYIWLNDGNGTRVAEAAIRAARRGVTVRAMADDIGSRGMIRSRDWARMKEAGVKLARALPVSNPFLHPIRGRIDLRNHRKIVVIDGAVTYCGSQNCADPAFLPKARYGPWVDLVVRFEGPVARQNQLLFIADWMAHVDEDLRELAEADAPLAVAGTAGAAAAPEDATRDPQAMARWEPGGGLTAQVIGTGPTVRPTAMPEMFEVLMHGARRELVVTTPYYVPTEAMQSALCITARRGVATSIVFPTRNDSLIVAAASRSYYSELLEAGVRIYEYPLGLLHSKSLTLDGEVALIGSANLDRRSFELNYENNILISDTALTGALRARQQSYIDASDEVLPRDVAEWSVGRRLWYNAIAMFGPVL